MTTSPVRVERRAGQRFPYLLAVSFRQPAGSIEGVGFTQDLSSRGVFFFTDAHLTEGSEIELTLRMPSEITLGESMMVRCRGHILRIVRPAAAFMEGSSRTVQAETKIGVAVRLEGYEYLTEPAESFSTPARASALHPQRNEEHPLVHSSARSLVG
ncbi:MAG TPA: PilZ domain-containing protein [Candidatus Dormibacteraeota bacterium]|nr:PilZ domain-containing protein [Candidatus Dormibacteraeota bacterium]